MSWNILECPRVHWSVLKSPGESWSFKLSQAVTGRPMLSQSVPKYPRLSQKYINLIKSSKYFSKEDYSATIPPNSFIHVSDYKTPEDLMKSLEKISQNETLYQSYFWWKSFYELKMDFKEETKCLLCQLLNDKIHQSENDYSNFIEYWNKCRGYMRFL